MDRGREIFRMVGVVDVVDDRGDLDHAEAEKGGKKVCILYLRTSDE